MRIIPALRKTDGKPNSSAGPIWMQYCDVLLEKGLSWHFLNHLRQSGNPGEAGVGTTKKVRLSYIGLELVRVFEMPHSV